MMVPAPEIARDMAQRFAGAPSDDDMLRSFKGEYPSLRFVACTEDDVPARLSPWVEVDGVEVYLIDGSEHCLSLSRDPETACGLVFARQIPA
jgi:hypothetical protein